MYKRKVQKVNLVNIEIINESKSKINFKWRKFLKLSVTTAFFKQLFGLYEFFFTSKFSKIKQDFQLILKDLQNIFFNVKLSSQKRELIMKLFYQRKIVFT